MADQNNEEAVMLNLNMPQLRSEVAKLCVTDVWAGVHRVLQHNLQEGSELRTQYQDTCAGDNVLSECSKKGYVQLIELFIQNGYPINRATVQYTQYTMLHHSAEYGHLAVITYLLSHGADVDVRTTLHCTPLMLAVANNHMDVVDVLINAGADITAKNMYNRTLLSYAVYSGDIGMVQNILNMFFDVNVAETEPPLSIAILTDNVDIAKLLIEKGASVNGNETTNVMKPVHCAAASKHSDILKLLVDLGADINVIAWDGKSALHFAARNNQNEAIQFLIELNLDINIRDNNDKTPLMYALYKNCTETVKILLEAGATVDLEKDDLNDCFYEHCLRKNFDMMEMLLELGANIEHKCFWGRTNLFNAVKNNNTEMVKWFLERGADPNNGPQKGEYLQPLHLAASRCALDIVNLLIEYNADVNYGLDQGNTPLHCAITSDYEGRVEIVKILLDHGANPNITFESDATVLHWVAQEGDLELLSIFLQIGLDKNATDSKGLKPIDYASRAGNDNIVHILQNHIPSFA